MQLRLTDLSFRFRDKFAGPLPEAYQRLLLDVIHGDASLFARADEVETAWSIVREDGALAGADLVVERVPERWACALCGVPVPAKGTLRCPECDAAATLLNGDDLVLDRIEVVRD